MNCSLPGSFVQEVFQARILDWVAFSTLTDIGRTVTLPAIFLGGISGKEPSCQCRRQLRDTASVPGSGRSPGGGHGIPRQYSCLENPMDRGA